MRLLLQFPEGLKKEAAKYAERYAREGHEVFLSASPCYGACDLALDEARAVGAQKIIHFGHAPFIREGLPVEVEYVEWREDVDLGKFGEAIAGIPGQSVVLATTVQHIHQIGEMKKMLGRAGKKVLVGKGVVAAYPGQVLGCDAGAVSSVAKDADAIVFVGDGNFHALAIDAEAGAEGEKPVFVIHPKSGQIRKINDEIGRVRKRRKGALAAALTAKTFGILVSTKPGQFSLAAAEWAKRELESRGRRAEILVAGEIPALCLNNFMLFECYITAACPRLSDDWEAFGRPVLDMGMLRQVLEMTRKKE